VLTRAEGLNGGRIFVQERLHQLAERRQQVEASLERARAAAATLATHEVDEVKVRQMLEDCQAIFGEDLQPYKRKELLTAAMQRIEFSDTVCRAGLKLSPAVLTSDRSNDSDSLPNPGRGASITARNS